VDARLAFSQTAPVHEPLARRAFDIACAATGLVVLGPVFAMIAVAIKLNDGGPVFYSQSRVGKGFRKFRLLKFRSMFCSSACGGLLTLPGDARVTRVGRFLRGYKLDELPQLVNVLKGEMQLVGVRPQVEKYAEIYAVEYGELLKTPPGITDLASLSFRNEERLFHGNSIEERYIEEILPVKLQMSLQYARSRTFISDIEILARTVLGLQAPSAGWRDAMPGLHVQSPVRFAPRKSA
jgi:lipopolysaccharide/colanic/teichoic acid biosynthesis glycosyltransferase